MGDSFTTPARTRILYLPSGSFFAGEITIRGKDGLGVLKVTQGKLDRAFAPVFLENEGEIEVIKRFLIAKRCCLRSSLNLAILAKH